MEKPLSKWKKMSIISHKLPKLTPFDLFLLKRFRNVLLLHRLYLAERGHFYRVKEGDISKEF